MPDPLASASMYEAFIYGLADRFPPIHRSTLIYVASGSLFGRVEGPRLLCGERRSLRTGIPELRKATSSKAMATRSRVPSSILRVRVRQGLMSTAKPLIPNKEKLYWYNSFPHPNDPSLASPDPHHKHVPPDIKHHRIPAPDLGFTHPNLPFLIEEMV